MKNIKTEWNLKLLYKDDNDPKIEKDLQAFEEACLSFEKKYRNKDFTSTPKTLFLAIREWEKIEDSIKGEPSFYFFLRKATDSSNKNVVSQVAKIEKRLNIAKNRITFFSLKLGKIPKNKQKLFLKDKSLFPYKYLLERIFLTAKYNLSEPEEKLENLLSQTSYSMWVDGQEKLLNSQEVNLKGEKIPIGKALNLIKTLPKKERRDLHKDVFSKLKEISPFAESEVNAVINFKSTMDTMRGYKEPFSATVLHYENEDSTVNNVVSTVSRYFKISQRFYKIHAKLLGEEKIFPADMNVPVGEIKRSFSFDKASSLVHESINEFNPLFAKFFEDLLKDGHIDVYARKGKDSGGFCASTESSPIFILLNHVDDLHSIKTLAHEMGHAIHSKCSKSQPKYYRDYSTSTAEVASTFFEKIVIDKLRKELSEQEQFILLHQELKDAIGAVFRQIAFFNFELELHKKIKLEGFVQGKDIASLLVKHLRSYTGSAVEIKDDDGYAFLYWSHLRFFFYVYSYAFGYLVSRALYEKWKEDKTFAKKIEQFLSAGGSMSPEDIFKGIGIDVRRPDFFETGLKAIESDIKKLEKLAKKLKK